jgi:hypothetical protein
MRENHLFSGERGRLRAAVRLDVVRGQYDKHGFGNCIIHAYLLNRLLIISGRRSAVTFAFYIIRDNPRPLLYGLHGPYSSFLENYQVILP